ncbi:FKBP-type peptidyl-prolyl cis-trans isomerase [Actinomadura sp. HBU206391]|uniref:FKBP-type peptidyl-prolyl cis-trans isomerase n=1 Tax=Actinomadura sp. HBU206391 TaxID=2731692 RepID=UPI00165059DC|nr:FKBP-type peptidyl-prolyl cis-trans isomerase [Actinomadura sp. HBU206391]MBC6462569.1 FKBP-type peptidyl-prolyl cis-trans isomerase [Actinomadura sp. HBU206391]
MSEDDKPRGEPAVKAKLPSGRGVGRSEFTPHGIGGRSRSKVSAMTAAKAKRRQRVLAGTLVVVVLASAGVGIFIATRPEPAIAITGAFGKQPKVDIPKEVVPPTTLQKKALITGKGAKVADGDVTFVNVDSYVWSGKGVKKQLDSTYKTGKPVPLQLNENVLPGLKKGLLGQQAGSRVLVQIPPKDGLGEQGNPQAGIKGTDTLIFIVDVVSTISKTAAASGTEKQLDDSKLPKVTPGEVGKQPTDLKMPKNDPPSKLVAKTLIEGSGPAVADGQVVVAQYKGQLWRNGKVFDASWKNGSLFLFPLGGQGAIKGFSTGLKGQKVGSRVMLVIPPKDGYGKQGSGEIKGTDTMVFMVDILGAA